jgi:BirA family biotin operon repressor/biotin-[acetyl-CoA-carboxylase] ligase
MASFEMEIASIMSSVIRDVQSEFELMKKLDTKRFKRLRKISPVCLYSIDSTQNYLGSLPQNTIEGLVVISQIQTEGRGRQGRKWISQKGGLWLSISLCPPPNASNQLTLVASKSVIETFEIDFAFPGCTIKEPNDVILRSNKKKIAGVLADASIRGDSCLVILGVGVNVNNSVKGDEHIGSIATSYYDETGKQIPILDFAAAFLSRLDQNYDKLCQNADLSRAYSKA